MPKHTGYEMIDTTAGEVMAELDRRGIPPGQRVVVYTEVSSEDPADDQAAWALFDVSLASVRSGFAGLDADAIQALVDEAMAAGRGDNRR